MENAFSIRDALQQVEARLERAGVLEPMVEAEWLVGFVTGRNRSEVFLHRSEILEVDAVDQIESLVQRREQRVPLQHLIGSVSFMGYPILVSPEALIPRPETEILAERAIERVKRFTDTEEVHLFDFGTGTGCLPIAITLAESRVKAIAVDISPDALRVARSNVAQHGLEQRIELVLSDGFAAIPEGRLFDVMVSNPPYIARAEIDLLQPEVAQFDPRLALDGGEDGLDYYRRIARQAPAFIRKEGCLLLEIGAGQHDAIQSIFAKAGWTEGELVRDYSQRERVLEFCR